MRLRRLTRLDRIHLGPFILWLALAAAVFAPAQADDRDFTGTVTKIFDGDSFLVRLAGGRDIDVRLIDIDAPEKDQPHADRSRAALQELIGARRVFVDVIDVDQYERKLARVYREADRLDVGRALVHDGHVWVYRRTARDRSLLELEDAAKASRSGLWALPDRDRIPPWRFRRLEREEKKKQPQKGAQGAKNADEMIRAGRLSGS